MFSWLKNNQAIKGLCSFTDSAFQRARIFLFCLSLLIFFVGLPLILSFALGYKFNAQNLKFIKTGLIYIKTQPEGATIHLNGRLIAEKSPASIQELIPGVYKVTLSLAKYYPWRSEIDVEAGKVSRIDKVILFPLRPNLEKLNQQGFSSFRLDSENGKIYYLDQENKVVYVSEADGSNFEDIAGLPDKFGKISGWALSPDKDKMFIFNPHQISIISLDIRDDYIYSDSFVYLDYPQETIIQVFWHSDSYHLIVLTDRHVSVIESRLAARAVNLIELDKEAAEAFYDNKGQALYFSYRQKRPDGAPYNDLYKLDLSPDLYFLEKLINKANE